VLDRSIWAHVSFCDGCVLMAGAAARGVGGDSCQFLCGEWEEGRALRRTPPRGGRCAACAHAPARGGARAQGINGNKMEKACDLCHITLNKNAVVGDVSALAPGGVRVGAPAMTSRGLVEADFKVIADFLHELVQLCLDVQKQTGKLYKDFEKCGPGIAYNLSRITCKLSRINYRV